MKLRTIIAETLLITVAGVAFALAANALSPRGLKLSRDYFPGGTVKATAATAPGSVTSNANPANVKASTPAAAPLDPTAQRLQQRGLQLVDSKAVLELFRDPGYSAGLILFVDARDDEHYGAGHIPGAWQFNHYRPENYLPTVLPLSLTAQKVIVYCTGGQCEDSEFAAMMLRDNGVPRENLFVYTGGITEWKAQGHPVETGARSSGQILKQ